VKRGLDIAISIPTLIVLAPVLAAIALAIRLDSRGRAIYRQSRKGLRGREFDIFKFRTMIEGADELRESYDDANERDGVLFKIQDDPRRTRVGRRLRRWSLDELPQFWNVVRGDMSLVGPRPMPTRDYQVDEEESALRRRLHVRPGLTGLWQVSGRSSGDSSDLLQHDLTYVQNWGVLLDVYILARTLPTILSGKGAY
jgi:lipopolysaccharide/colanic/teichoic acid biosynthesis glycosyltransferase